MRETKMSTEKAHRHRHTHTYVHTHTHTHTHTQYNAFFQLIYISCWPFEKVIRQYMCQKTKQGSSSMINVEDLPKIIFAIIIMGQKYSLIKNDVISTEIKSRLRKNLCWFSSDVTLQLSNDLGLLT